MPKLIDYPRTSYPGAWEVAETVDDTGGKCALETSARKLNRKVSGSFKAIVGSAVKFGLLTSKRELLTTTTLFRRIKHAYDKQEELLFHREAFLTPPLFTQLCRKFRSRELPVAMLDVLLMREFEVEEINAQSVAKAFVDGARMVGLLNEDNMVADIDQLAARQPPRRELASPNPSPNVFRQMPLPTGPAAEASEDNPTSTPEAATAATAATKEMTAPTAPGRASQPLPPSRTAPSTTTDAIASLFGLGGTSAAATQPPAAAATGATPGSGSSVSSVPLATPPVRPARPDPTPPRVADRFPATTTPEASPAKLLFQIQLVGPGLNTQLEVTDVDDLALVRALLDKIERRLRQ